MCSCDVFVRGSFVSPNHLCSVVFLQVNCKSCCGGYELDHHDVKLVTPRRDRRNNSIDSSTLHDLLGDSNIQDNAFLGDRKMQMQDEAKSSISFTI